MRAWEAAHRGLLVVQTLNPCDKPYNVNVLEGTSSGQHRQTYISRGHTTLRYSQDTGVRWKPPPAELMRGKLGLTA